MSVDGGHRSLSLDEVELATLDEEHLAIFHKGQQRAWHKQRVEAIANVAVFKGLLDHLLQQLARWMVPNAALLKELTASLLQEQQQQMQAYAPAHLQQVLATYHAGMPVTFGSITLSLQGVALDQGRKVLPWSECIGINIAWNFHGGAVLIGKRGKNRAWGVISFADVPDLGLFQALVNHLNHNYTP